MTCKKLLNLLILIGGIVVLTQAQTDSFADLLRANTFPIQIENGKMFGKGAEVIQSALTDVQFVALGEEHNKRAVHQFGDALFRLLHEKHGFNYLALEEDAYWGKMLSEAAKKGGGEEVISLALRYPNAFHLLTEEEMSLIGNIGKISKAKYPVWGLNQVFGAVHIYERLIKIAPNKQAREVAQKLLDQALNYEKERFQRKIHYLAKVAKPKDFDLLRSAFQPPKNSEAEFLIEQISLSNQIFAPYVAVPRPSSAVLYESGKIREVNMKQLFARHYKEAQKSGDSLPKVMAMFGQLHLYRGLSERTEQYTLGNFLSEFANFNNQKSLQIYTTINADFIHKGAFMGLAKTASAVAGKNNSGAVVDLRTLFDYAKNNKEMNPELRRLIMSYDIFVFLMDGQTGSTKRLQTPNFNWYPN